MLIYEATKSQFLHDNDHSLIEDVILDRYIAATGKRVGKAEIRSWKESMRYMALVLRDEGIPTDSGVAVELQVPQTSKRIDMTISGYDDAGQKKVIVIELKQWESIEVSPMDAVVKTFLGGGIREAAHPSYQAWSYVSLLEGFNELVSNGDILVQGCAYLHNYSPDGKIDALHYSDHIQKAPLFLKGPQEKNKLCDFIKKHVKHGDNKAVLYALDSGRIRPSKALSDSLSSLMKGNQEFVLIDDQKVIFETCLAAAQQASAQNPKVVIIDGGPGTGKSVLAINLLVRLTALSLNCRYVTKNSAPREVYKTKLTGTLKQTQISNFFTGSGAFIDTPPNSFDTLVVDEAHRLNEKSGLYSNLGNHQVKELIDSACCTVFFIDEDQRIALNDAGTKDTIRQFAASKNAEVIELALTSQFRCSGSDGYLSWLTNTLGMRETANEKLSPAEYEFKVFDDPAVMHAAVVEKNTNNKARVVAGYCWPWNSKKQSAAWDIVIGNNYSRRWNLSDDGNLWIITPSSIEEVGCIHTCQGLEVDYIGVIIGPDLLVRDGVVKCVPSARDRHDKTMRGFKKLLAADPIETAALGDRLIKNTYRTLMTRGSRGCYVYSEDAETRDYFRSRLSP